MNIERIITIMSLVIGSGGFTALITSLFKRKKNAVDIDKSNIEVASKLRDIAVEDAMSWRTLLSETQKSLSEAQKLLTVAESRYEKAVLHIKNLETLLDKNNISYVHFEEGYEEKNKR